jgi:transposase
VDFRRLAFMHLQRSRSIRQTARVMQVSPSTIHRWKTSSFWVKTLPAKRRRRRDDCRTHIIAYFEKPENRVTATCDALRREVAKLGVSVSNSSIRRCLRDMRYSRKRRSDKVLGTVSAEKVAAFRQRYSAAVKPGTLVVSVDECHFSERVMPRYGYSPIGERSPARSQSGSWKARSLILGIASDGQHHHQLIDGSVTRACFGEYVKSLPFPSGAVILMDNCKIHEQLDVVFASKGYIPLFLSPYSPMFQPVELAFSKVKGMFRQAWPWPRGVDDAVVRSVNELTAENITGFFRHACREMTKSSGWST